MRSHFSIRSGTGRKEQTPNIINVNKHGEKIQEAGNGIAPGQTSYAKAALNRAVSSFTVRAGGSGNGITGNVIVGGDKLYAPSSLPMVETSLVVCRMLSISFSKPMPLTVQPPLKTIPPSPLLTLALVQPIQTVQPTSRALATISKVPSCYRLSQF